MRRLFAAAATILFTMMTAGAVSAQNWDAVVAAAKKEGQVVVYSGFAGAQEPLEVNRLFEKRYGITVKVLEGAGSEIAERVRTEVSTGHSIGDVTTNGATANTGLSRSNALQLAGDLPNLSKVVLQPTFPEEVPILVNVYGIVINTDMVKPDQEPKSWADILDPKWKGKILSDQMWTSGTGHTWFSVTLDKFGEDFHRKLATQNLRFSRAVRENPRSVARGEYAMYITTAMSDVARLEGLPVKGIVPKEGLPYTPFSGAVIRNAPHPNAARVYINFLLEPESQLIYAKGGYPVSTGNLGNAVPENLRYLVNAPLLGRQNLDGQAERLKLAKQIYGG